MDWKHDWLHFETRVGVGVVALVFMLYGASRVIDWFTH